MLGAEMDMTESRLGKLKMQIIISQRIFKTNLVLRHQRPEHEYSQRTTEDNPNPNMAERNA
jgi:hypothetical protein